MPLRSIANEIKLNITPKMSMIYIKGMNILSCSLVAHSICWCNLAKLKSGSVVPSWRILSNSFLIISLSLEQSSLLKKQPKSQIKKKVKSPDNEGTIYHILYWIITPMAKMEAGIMNEEIITLCLLASRMSLWISLYISTRISRRSSSPPCKQ